MATLLQDFIAKRLEEYGEQSRKGVPRGQKIGFSRKKFHACLLYGLTKRRHKAIIAEVGVTFGVFKRWTQELDFLHWAEKIYTPWFINAGMEYLLNKHAPEPNKKGKTDFSAFDKMLSEIKKKKEKGSKEKAKRTKSSSEIFIGDPKLKDASLYAPWIQDELLDWATEIYDPSKLWNIRGELDDAGVRYTSVRLQQMASECRQMTYKDRLSRKDKKFIYEFINLIYHRIR